MLAHNFVDAWKMGVKEGHLGASFFDSIEGTQPSKESGAGRELTGLTVVDDLTFTIKLTQPEADFPAQLGYTAFSPLPDSTLADPVKGGEVPVGNGMYKFASDSAWEHNVKISLVPNENYTGSHKVMNGGVDLIVYTQTDAAYSDLQSNVLDFLDQIPASATEVFENELGDRAVNQPAAVFQSFTILSRLEHFSGEEGNLRRQAISHAIDRDQITKSVFNGTRTPAKDFTSPVIDGYNDSLPGSEVLTYNPDKAKELWAKADAISPWSGTFAIAYNSDAAHQPWVDAVANSIKNTLGIDAEGNPYADFKSLRTDITNRDIKTAFRWGWQADYPGKKNFLDQLYSTTGGSNDGDYSSKEFDSLMTKSSGADSAEESNAILDEAQELLFKDLPAIPLWYMNVNGGWSQNVDNVTFNWKSVPVYNEITKNA